MMVSVLFEDWSRPTTAKVYMFSLSEAGAPAFGSSVGAAVGSAASSAPSVSAGAVLSFVASTSPAFARSGGFSHAR